MLRIKGCEDGKTVDCFCPGDIVRCVEGPIKSEIGDSVLVTDEYDKPVISLAGTDAGTIWNLDGAEYLFVKVGRFETVE